MAHASADAVARKNEHAVERDGVDHFAHGPRAPVHDVAAFEPHWLDAPRGELRDVALNLAHRAPPAASVKKLHPDIRR